MLPQRSSNWILRETSRCLLVRIPVHTLNSKTSFTLLYNRSELSEQSLLSIKSDPLQNIFHTEFEVLLYKDKYRLTTTTMPMPNYCTWSQFLHENFHLDGNSQKERGRGRVQGWLPGFEQFTQHSSFSVFILWRRHRMQNQNKPLQQKLRMTTEWRTHFVQELNASAIIGHGHGAVVKQS